MGLQDGLPGYISKASAIREAKELIIKLKRFNEDIESQMKEDVPEAVADYNFLDAFNRIKESIRVMSELVKYID